MARKLAATFETDVPLVDRHQGPIDLRPWSGALLSANDGAAKVHPGEEIMGRRDDERVDPIQMLGTDAPHAAWNP
jgi:hypothetical protein